MRRRIVLLPGDGVGPEVIAEGRRVLEAVASSRGFGLDFVEAAVGGNAIDLEGVALPPSTLAECERASALFLGAVGGPKWSDPTAPVRPEDGLLALRKRFELFANLRPIPVYRSLVHLAPMRAELLAGVDLLFVRELTGDVYFGPRQEQGSGSSAYDTMVYSVPEVERIARVAFEAARGRRRKLTSVDKANVLASMRLWRRTVERVARDYPDVELEHALVDSCAMHLVRRPASFDVILAGNMFGDILSDEASVLSGSLGMLPSASLGSGRFGLYEPVHGSAPDIAGRGIANPIGAVLSAAMLLRFSLGRADDAAAVERSVERALDGGAVTADLVASGAKHLSTRAMGDAILDRLSEELAAKAAV
ncbi:MAG TPA: 3-isopropylmalate dehydrogenase [Thermoanaerobaculia bacterium]|nr:3-isopropylmalate dehydrogenase [Thermoanaerobaculia bacterium]